MAVAGDITAALHRQHTADIGTLSAKAAHENLNTTLTSLTHLAAVPGQEDVAQSHWDAAINTMLNASPGMKATDKATFQMTIGQDGHKLIASGALASKILANPTAAIADVAAGKHSQYLNEKELDTAIGHAQDVQRMETYQKRADAADAREQQRLNVEGATGRLYASTLNPDGTTTIGPDFFKNVKTLALMPGGAPSAEALGRFGQAAQRDVDRASSPGAYDAALSGIKDGSTTADTIISQMASIGSDHIARVDGNDILSKLKPTPENHDEVDMLKASHEDALNQINPAAVTGALTQAQSSRAARFETWFRPAYRAALKTATPAELLSPDSPKYMLGPDVIKRFTQTQGADVVGPSFLQRFGAAISGAGSSGTPSASAPIKDRPSLDSILGPSGAR